MNTDAVDITADNVTLDLNGFAISGPVTCLDPQHQPCSGAGSGIGVKTTNSNITVRNGTVRGMGNSGIVLGNGALVEDVHADSNGGAAIPNGSGGAGIKVYAGVVTHCTVTRNWGYGILAHFGVTISFSSVESSGDSGIYGGDVVNSDVSRNGRYGIQDAQSAVSNTLFQNSGYALAFVYSDSGYFGNVMFTNGGTVSGGTSLGHNLCNTTVC